MNLIEQLGGYAQAKNYAVDANACGAFNDEKKIKSALLEYRRQHNVYEVGDKVVIKAEPFWPEDYAIETVEQKDIGRWYMSAWRHATDAEIKAGKRL